MQLEEGPKKFLPAPQSSRPIHADIGTRGEFAAWWLERFSDEDVDPARRLASEPGTTLRTTGWRLGERTLSRFRSIRTVVAENWTYTASIEDTDNRRVATSFQCWLRSKLCVSHFSGRPTREAGKDPAD